MPRVSILLPTLNSRRFLDERLSTIIAQTFTDWELIVADSNSDDGTWESLKQAAERDSRISLAQTPRDGLYANWNRCIVRARGEFVYIATSDDTMQPDCLAKLVAALDQHPECGIAQCCLHAIDASGRIVPGWWKLVGAARALGPLYLQSHLRRAPIDGLLQCAVGTMYHSVTQILVRRRVFGAVGNFPTTWNSAGDFVWGLRAGLATDVVHVPEFLATWRQHDSQASACYRYDAAETARVLAMTEAALSDANSLVPPGITLPPRPKLLFPHRFNRWRTAWAETPTLRGRMRLLWAIAHEDAFSITKLASLYARCGVRTFDGKRYMESVLGVYGLAGLIIPLENDTPRESTQPRSNEPDC